MPQIINVAKIFQFEVATPYHAGSILSDGEAHSLNVLRADNIRLNASREFQRLLAGREELPRDEALTFIEWFKNYEPTYRFQARRRRQGVHSSADSLGKFLREVATELAHQTAEKQGFQIKPEFLEATVRELMTRPDVKEEALQRQAEAALAAEAEIAELFASQRAEAAE